MGCPALSLADSYAPVSCYLKKIDYQEQPMLLRLEPRRRFRPPDGPPRADGVYRLHIGMMSSYKLPDFGTDALLEGVPCHGVSSTTLEMITAVAAALIGIFRRHRNSRDFQPGLMYKWYLYPGTWPVH